MSLSHTLRSAAVAGLIGLGFMGASATPALADHVRTKCDNDGDYCWRVWCDRDWDDCHPVPGSIYHRYSYYNRDRYYGRGRYYGGDYYSRRRPDYDDYGWRGRDYNRDDWHY